MTTKIPRRTFTIGTLLALLRPSLTRSAAVADEKADGTSVVTIIENGRPNLVLVTPDQAVPAVTYAAQEFTYHLEKATGTKPPTVTESAAVSAGNGVRVYIGDTLAARAAGIKCTLLVAESCVLKTTGDSIFIAGLDDPGDPLDRNTSAGSLFGVYEVLERYLRVRWLWPGDLGTYVPKVRSLIVPAGLRQTVVPRFFQRHVRTGLDFQTEHPALGFTAKSAEAYAQNQAVFLRRHRQGRSQKVSYGHAFTSWWKQYGAQHPDWFQLVNGKRGPAKAGGRYSMSVSNPGLQTAIINLWRSRGATKPGPSYINAVENDIPGLCECPQCRALDGPEPANYRKFISPKSKIFALPAVSDRYARFWLGLQQMAAKENPNVTVVGYAYFNYFTPPTSGVKLNSNILIGFCPSGWFYPRSAEEHSWMKGNWNGWAETGARIFSRTNYFLDGYCMPFIFAHQFADDFQNAARHQLFGTDFDSLTGQWATQGPNLYLLMCLQTRPDVDADLLLNEYYSAFGPAAEHVKAYFDYWEQYTMENRSLIVSAFEKLEASRWRSWARAAHAVYPEDCFAPGEALLAKAAEVAASDSEASQRVQFLQAGLTHAKLCSRVARLLTLGDPKSTPERGKAALMELLKFRRANEQLGISNLNQLAWVEEMSWKLSNETKKTPDLYP